MDRKRAGLGLEMRMGVELGCERKDRWSREVMHAVGWRLEMGTEMEEGAKDGKE